MRFFSSSSSNRIGFRNTFSQAPSPAQSPSAPLQPSDLQPAYESAGRNLESVRAAVDLAIMARQEAAHQTNQPIHSALQAASQTHEKQLTPASAREEESRLDREEAHARAAQTMGLAGEQYDRRSPDPEAPYRARRMSRDEAIHRLGLSDAKTPPKWAKWLGTALLAIPVGSLFALSLGIKAGLMDPEIALNLEPDRIGPFIAMILLGIGLAVIVGLALEAAVRFAAEQRNLRGWVWQTWAAMIFAGALFMTLTIGDALLQMTGLMAVAEAMSLSEDTLPWAVFFIISLVITLPYMALKSYHGAAEGLKRSCDMKSDQFIEHETANEATRRRSDPLCQEASVAVAHAMNADRRHEEAVRDRKLLEAEQAKALDSLRRQLLPISADPTPEEKLSLQEAELRLKAAQVDLEEGGPSFRGDHLRRQADAVARRLASLQ